MDWPLVIFSLSVIVFAYRGLRTGLLKSLSRLLSLVSGYLAAILYSKYLAAIFEATTDLDGLVAILLASLILFLWASLMVLALFWLIGKLKPKRPADNRLSATGGAIIGVFSGTIVGIIAVWIFGFVNDMTTTEITTGTDSQIQNLASQAASKAVQSALTFADVEPEITRLGTAFVATPGQIALQAQRLTESNDLANLLNNPQNQQLLSRGDVESVKAVPAFQQLADNSDLQALMNTSGMLNNSDGNTESINTLLAEKLVDIWQRMDRVKSNQRVQEILKDEEFQRKIQSGNPLDLLTNSQLLELANILFEDNGEELPIDSKQADSLDSSQKNTTVYRWVDENGKVHYSDKAPE